MSAVGASGTRLRGVAVVVVGLAVIALLGSALGQWSGGSAPSERAAPSPPAERVTVEVLNGGGVSGQASAATRLLRNRGFDVVYYGNRIPFREDSSVVIARTDHRARAEAVADALGIRHIRVQPDSNLFLDVTVVLGVEWTGRDPTGRAGVSPAWWDPRRFFRSRTDPAGETDGSGHQGGTR